jgi:hypothetical protein
LEHSTIDAFAPGVYPKPQSKRSPNKKRVTCRYPLHKEHRFTQMDEETGDAIFIRSMLVTAPPHQ